MPDPPSNGTGRRLARDLGLLIVLGAALYVLFTFFETKVFRGFTPPEFLAVEAAAIVLVAYLVARTFSATASAILARRGQSRHGASVRLFLNLLLAIGTVLALFHLAGVSAESIFLGSAFAGIVLGLASQTVLANVFAGLLLVIANPFRPGDRVSFVSSSYGMLAPTYPHEVTVPAYAGVVEDVGLVYTVLGLDVGGTARIPNATVLTALLLQPRPGAPRAHRIRMTFPIEVAVATVEAALPEVAAVVPGSAGAPSAPRLEIADVSPTTWDGVVVLWSSITDENLVRDRVLRTVIGRLAARAPAPGGAARPAA